jgi:glycosyltransferase involved in cell wall biosynthesis
MATDRWDVLVNPRRSAFGNHNNFASKLFQYALAGRPILTTQISGEEIVLGGFGFFFDGNYSRKDIELALNKIRVAQDQFHRIAEGAYKHVHEYYTWELQTNKVINFLKLL